jgi:hypothetical protein
LRVSNIIEVPAVKFGVDLDRNTAPAQLPSRKGIRMIHSCRRRNPRADANASDGETAFA